MFSAPPKWLRITVVVLAAIIGVVLMGGSSTPGSRGDELLAILGIAVLVGGWLWATRHRASSAGQAHNERELKDIERQLENYETPGLLLKKGETLVAMHRYKQAIEPLERAIELEDQEDLRAHYLLGQARFHNRDFQQAWQHFDTVFRADKNHDYGEIRLWAARTFIELGDADHAEKMIEEFLANQPGHLGGLALKGDALWSQGRRSEAAAAYREFLQSWLNTVEFGRVRYVEDAKRARKRANG